MAPNIRFRKLEETHDFLEKVEEEVKQDIAEDELDNYEYKVQIVWRNVILMGSLHLASLYAIYLGFTVAKWQTTVAAFIMYVLGGVGITAGSHRLWAHRSYKARFPLRVFLCILQTLAFQNDIYEWARDHRVHHKYTETDADPHNSRRGFFFSHVGWLLVRKHRAVIQKGKQIDMSDIWKDPIVRFQKKYYIPMMLLICFMIPSAIPVYFWGESLYNAFYLCGLFRYCLTLNMTWLVNSAAHMWGRRPYDNSIDPTENVLTVFGAHGEGYHNYHHTFPWDYAASELGTKFNITTMLINSMAAIGQAYDLKTAAPSLIKQRKLRTGDRPEQEEYSFY